MPLSTTGWPLISSSPSSGEYAPPRIFINVLLPAPFSPISASTSPAFDSNDTSLSATTPGKRLVIPRIVSRCAAASPIFLFCELRHPLLEFLHVLRGDHFNAQIHDRILRHRRVT